MSTSTEAQSRRERSWLYIVSCILLVVMAVVAIFVFAGARETRKAQEKADTFIAALKDAGARTPDKDQVVRVLGDDGGATCANPNEALSRATLQSLLANGATGPGARPVVADSRVFKGQLLILDVYCPEELDEFKAWVEDLKSGDVAG